MDKQQGKKLIIELMEISEACYLTTIDDLGFPQTRAMLNLRNSGLYPNLVPLFKKHNNDHLVYFTTNASSQKIIQIKNNPKVSVYYAKPIEWRGLMLGGTMEIVEEQAIKDALWQDSWTMYYPGGPTDDDYAILGLTPDILKLYHQLDFFTLYPE